MKRAETIKIKCKKCGLEFQVPAPKEIYENWQGAEAVKYLSEHKTLAPDCVDPILHVVVPYPD